MKCKTMIKNTIGILPVLFVIMTTTVSAQEIHSQMVNAPIHNQTQTVNPEVRAPINPEVTAPAHSPIKSSPETPSTVISGPELKKVESVPEVPSTIISVPKPEKQHIVTSKEVMPEVQSAINDLEVKADEIFSPVFSEVTNLKVNPVVEDEKVVYQLELPVDTPIYREKEVVQPIFDLRVDKPVEFKLVDDRIIINDEQIIDYKEIVREKEVFPPVQTEIQSEIDSGVYDLKVVPEVNSAVFRFIYREKEVQMPVYSDFKIENKKLYLTRNNKLYDLKVTPPEVYSAVYSTVEKNPEVLVKSLDLKVEDEKPVYDLRVEEPFKLFWIIPMKINSRYIIDSSDGSISKKEKPWFSFFGRVGFKDSFQVIPL